MLPELIMNSMWIKGPTFLTEQDLHQPDSNYALVAATNDKEIKLSVTSLKTNISKIHHTLLCRGWHMCEVYKSPESLSRAERQIIMECEWDSFSSETELLRKGQPLNKDNPVLVLSPQLDEDGLLRVGG